jgi:predicted nucleic acid-binding protein
MKDRLQAMIEEYRFLERCDAYSRSVLDVVLAGRPRADRGEAEAVVQAAPFNAMVVVDDPFGRQLASRFDLEYHGTLWILERLHGLGYLKSSVLRQNLLTLKQNKIRLPRAAMNELLGRIGERPI